MELSIDDNQSKGTRIIVGDAATLQWDTVNALAQLVRSEFNATPIILPTIEPSSLYVDKAGEEVLGQMYVFKDKGERELCLRPEATATVQAVARKHWKNQEKRVWYYERCYRYERPQAGRYREFNQFGVEWINPKPGIDHQQVLVDLAMKLCRVFGEDIPLEVHTSVKRGLSYYTSGGFEITCPILGAQKQVCGGGPYAEGIGFAIGVDRMLLARKLNEQKK